MEIAIDPWRHKTALPLSYIYTLIPLHMVYLIYLFTAIIVRARTCCSSGRHERIRGHGTHHRRSGIRGGCVRVVVVV